MMWDCGDFYRGALGGALQPMGAYFYLPWSRVMGGEDYTVEASSVDEWGGRSVWTLRFVPAGDD
jgi:hypothetical protein